LLVLLLLYVLSWGNRKLARVCPVFFVTLIAGETWNLKITANLGHWFFTPFSSPRIPGGFCLGEWEGAPWRNPKPFTLCGFVWRLKSYPNKSWRVPSLGWKGRGRDAVILVGLSQLCPHLTSVSYLGTTHGSPEQQASKEWGRRGSTSKSPPYSLSLLIEKFILRNWLIAVGTSSSKLQGRLTSWCCILGVKTVWRKICFLGTPQVFPSKLQLNRSGLNHVMEGNCFSQSDLLI
jgi:hypothetical protein